MASGSNKALSTSSLMNLSDPISELNEESRGKPVTKSRRKETLSSSWLMRWDDISHNLHYLSDEEQYAYNTALWFKFHLFLCQHHNHPHHLPFWRTKAGDAHRNSKGKHVPNGLLTLITICMHVRLLDLHLHVGLTMIAEWGKDILASLTISLMREGAE